MFPMKPTTAIFFLFMLLAMATQYMHAQTETVLYSFAAEPASTNPNGLVRDTKGNLYGTTYGEGNGTSCGIVFKITPAGTETVLHSFTGGTDGCGPFFGSLVRDSEGNLYGATSSGGSTACGGYGCGTVFKVTAKGAENVLYAFTGGTDGDFPIAGLVRDKEGNLYGTTDLGGTSGCGTVFELTATGTETVLHSFTAGADGAYPYTGGLIRDEKGNLYGTTWYGGAASACGDSGCGTVFEVTPTGTETVLFIFSGVDGVAPNGLVRDAEGNLYGTTSGGGLGSGTVFELTKKGAETTLYSFTGAPDGATPFVGLVRDPEGNLYGTTVDGGALGHGTVFEVTPAGTETVLYAFTGGTDGANPVAGLLMDKQGNF